MDLFVILNVDDLQDHIKYDCFFIPTHKRSSCLYYDKKTALDEITRLKQNNPSGHFLLFKEKAEYGPRDINLRLIDD